MHHVALDLLHTELDGSYGLRAGMQLFFRIPYDVKAQHVRYSTLDGAPFTPPYGDIHHRSETLTGITDPTLGLEWSSGPQWLFGAGVTVPAGETVPNPIVLGREGKLHEHIQFGSGTVRPIASLQWLRTGSRLPIALRAEAAFSLYENSEGYRAPSTLVWTAGSQLPVGRFSIMPALTGQWQSIGRWSGEADEGSGFSDAGISLRLGIPAGQWTIVPGVFREIWTHSLSDEDFRQGTTWSLGLTRAF